jgi:predicted hydrocarbon binding protein
MAEVKGPLLAGWLQFLKTRYGEAAVAAATERLRDEDKGRLAVRFLASSWYPYDTIHSLRRLTGALAATQPPDPTLPVQVGRAMARHAFTGVYGPLLKKAPAEQVAQFSSTADFFFREARRLESRMVDASTCAVRYVYEAEATPTAGMCASTAGFWCEALELAGAREVAFEHTRCRARGDPFCEFTFSWPP